MVRSGSYSKVFCFGWLIVAAAVSATGCLTSAGDDDSRGTGGAGGTTGGTGGGAGMSAAAGTGGGSTGDCTPHPPKQVCTGMAAPSTGVAINFASYQTSGTWGNSSAGELTGGTSMYKDDANASQMLLTNTVTDGVLHLAGTIPTMGYAGAVLWFGPCVDASAFTGVTFSVGGTTNGAVLKLQVQTHVDYPIDVKNTKGACDFDDCAQKWSECVPPTASVPVTADMVTQDMPWSTFTGGMPTAEVTPDGLVGLQFQLECQSTTDCAVDVGIGNISFTN